MTADVVETHGASHAGPSGYPFVFLDRIVREDEGRIVGIKNVSLSEPFVPGHFPGQPVMPGVLILESLLQASAVLLRKAAKRPYVAATLTGVEKMRFKRPVVPGDQLMLSVELTAWNGTAGTFTAEARVGEDLAAAGNFVLTLEESGEK